MDNQHTYNIRHVGEVYCVRVPSASGTTYDVRSVRVASSIFDVKCARVAAFLSGVYDMRRVRKSSAYYSSGATYGARCVGAAYCIYDVRFVYCSSVSRTSSCKVLSNVDRTLLQNIKLNERSKGKSKNNCDCKQCITNKDNFYYSVTPGPNTPFQSILKDQCQKDIYQQAEKIQTYSGISPKDVWSKLKILNNIDGWKNQQSSIIELSSHLIWVYSENYEFIDWKLQAWRRGTSVANLEPVRNNATVKTIAGITKLSYFKWPITGDYA
ncbi:21172_t:CDS:2, partial [Rhizophagus irregularis]